MESKICVFFIALFATNVFSIPEGRLKRSYNNNEYNGPTSYDVGSEERDASIEENVPCGIIDNSGSREHTYGTHEHPSTGHHKVSTSVHAAAEASASSYS